MSINDLRFRFDFLDGNKRAVFFSFAECYDAIHQCVERMVFADPYVLARMMYRTSLTYDDVACFGYFTTEKLNS